MTRTCSLSTLAVLSAVAGPTSAWMPTSMKTTSVQRASTKLYSDPNNFADKIERGDWEGLPPSLVQALQEQAKYEAEQQQQANGATMPPPPEPVSYAEKVEQGQYDGLPDSLVQALKDQEQYQAGRFVEQPQLSIEDVDDSLFSALFTPANQEEPMIVPTWVAGSPGIVAPLGFWDPLGLSSMVAEDVDVLKFLQESEYVHGRVAMMATVGILAAEQLREGPALHYTDNLSAVSWVALFLFSTGIEILRALIGFLPPKAPWDPTFTSILRPEYEPGNLDFDPLDLKPWDTNEFVEYRTRELQNGRLAMIAITGILVQEAVTNQPIF